MIALYIIGYFVLGFVAAIAIQYFGFTEDIFEEGFIFGIMLAWPLMAFICVGHIICELITYAAKKILEYIGRYHKE